MQSETKLSVFMVPGCFLEMVPKWYRLSRDYHWLHWSFGTRLLGFQSVIKKRTSEKGFIMFKNIDFHKKSVPISYGTRLRLSSSGTILVPSCFSDLVPYFPKACYDWSRRVVLGTGLFFEPGTGPVCCDSVR